MLVVNLLTATHFQPVRLEAKKDWENWNPAKIPVWNIL